MKCISSNDFLKYKTSDTIVIYGSGPSVKSLTIDDKKELSKFDSVGFNFFSKTGIETTFYIMGELVFNYYRASNKNAKLGSSRVTDIFTETGEDPKSYFDSFRKFKNSCYVVWNHKFIKNCPHWRKLNNDMNNDYIFVKQYGHDPYLKEIMDGRKGRIRLNFDNSVKSPKKFIHKKFYTKKLLLDDGILLHSWKGVNSAIYFAKCMGYKNVIFSGVDLGNYGPDAYAFDRSKFVKKFISKIRKGYKTHPCKEMLFKFVNYLKMDINFYTYNPNSLLTEIIPTYESESFKEKN